MKQNVNNDIRKDLPIVTDATEKNWNLKSLRGTKTSVLTSDNFIWESLQGLVTQTQSFHTEFQLIEEKTEPYRGGTMKIPKVGTAEKICGVL